MKTENALLRLWVLQVRYQKRNESQTYSEKQIRLNPINPLSYMIAILMLFFSIFAYGIKGTYEDFENPFKYQ